MDAQASQAQQPVSTAVSDREQRIIAEVARLQKELYDSKEVSSYFQQVIRVVIEGHTRAKKPLAPDCDDRRVFIRRKVDEAFGPVRLALIEGGLPACGVKHMIWLAGHYTWRSWVNENSDLPMERPENTAPLEPQYSLEYYSAKEEANRRGTRLPDFKEAQKAWFQENSERLEEVFKKEKEAEMARVEMEAIAKAKARFGDKFPEVKLDYEPRSLVKTWDAMMGDIPKPGTGAFTVELPLDLRVSPKVRACAELHYDCRFYIRKNPNADSWIIGVTFNQKLPVDQFPDRSQDLFRGYDAVVCFALEQVAKPEHFILFEDVAKPRHSRFEKDWKVADHLDEVKTNLEALTLALHHFREVRLDKEPKISVR